MSKAKMDYNLKTRPSIPGANYSRPSGASALATSDSPEALDCAIEYGNRATRRLAMQKINSSSHRKLMKSIGGDL